MTMFDDLQYEADLMALEKRLDEQDAWLDKLFVSAQEQERKIQRLERRLRKARYR